MNRGAVAAGCLWLLGLAVLVAAVLGGRHGHGDQRTGWSEGRVTFVVHSCDAYARYWDGWLHHWVRHGHPGTWPTRLLTETERPLVTPAGLDVVRTGPGPWAARLASGLAGIDTPYVVYVQEDAWLTSELRPSYLDRVVRYADDHRVLALKLFASCQHRTGDPTPMDVNDPQWYLVSHQPSLWRTAFLRSTLYPEQDAMAHELETNAMLHRYPELAAACHCHDAATSVVFPYTEVSRRGEWLPEGRALVHTMRRAEKKARRARQ